MTLRLVPSGEGPAGGRPSAPHAANPSPAESRDGVSYAFVVFVIAADGAVEKLSPPAGPLLIGRAAGSQVRLDDASVKDRHALIRLGPRGPEIEVMPGAACSMGGQAIQGCVPLDLGAPIRIGGVELRLMLTSRAPAAPASAVDVPVALRRKIHRQLVEFLDLVRLDRNRANDHLMRAKVSFALQELVERHASELPAAADRARLITELTNEAIGYGPLTELLEDPEITEIMVVDPETIYVERGRHIEKTRARFTDDDSVRAVIERIVTPLGRRVDESSPMLDARLPDGSRVNVVIRPLALRGTCITIRKFPKQPLMMRDLVAFGTLTPRMATFLERAVACRRNILVSGGTGSGKTTLLNILSASIPARERIVTIEDSAELRLQQPHVVTLESRPQNMEGRGEITIRDLVRNAMRMRPDRIIVGECRGGEALDMLQAMNTGHSGSMTTTHANSPREALARIETLALMGGLDLPSRALREQIALSLDLVVQQAHLSDGTRKLVSISEVVGLEEDGQLLTREIFGYRRRLTKADGSIGGEFYASGYLPTFLGDFLTHGLVQPGEPIL